MTKKKWANAVMIGIIVLIAVAGILTVGHIKGWFDKDEGTAFAIDRVWGSVAMERQGLSYTPESGTLLRPGDRLTTGRGTVLTLTLGDSAAVLDENTAFTVVEGHDGLPGLTVGKGGAFLDAGQTALDVQFADVRLSMQDGAALLSVLDGSHSLSMLAGSAHCGRDVKAGEMLSWTGSDCQAGPLAIQSLNDFAITRIRRANEHRRLFFTNDQLDELEADRLAAMEEMLDSQTMPPEPTGTRPTAPEPAPTTVPVTSPTEVPGTSADRSQTTGATASAGTTAPTKAPTEAPTTASTAPTKAPEKPRNLTCVINIRCDTILDNMENLEPGLAEFVPESGVILAPVKVKFAEGDTVFDVLKRVCTAFDIQLEYSFTPMYNSYYVEGINHLYEFSCGRESGWMYKVNGWYPNYGCSQYRLKDGDVISWNYTCNGLGADLGAPPMG